MKVYQCDDLSQTANVGAEIYALLEFPACVYLHGEMGVGKTTLSQSIIRAAGFGGPVTSPTYNLIHQYPVNAGIIYHLDLYRLDDPAELEFLGIKDIWQEHSMLLIEWPDNGQGFLLPANFHITMERSLDLEEATRMITFYRK